MNKLNRISINILCIIFISVLVASVLVPSTILSSAFLTGFSDGYKHETSSTKMQISGLPMEVALDTYSVENFAITDTIRSDRGEIIPLEIHRATIRVPSDDYPLWALITVSGSYIALAVVFVMIVIQLIKFTVKINKGSIFESCNASLLNKIGILLIILSVLKIIPGLTEDSVIDNLNLSYNNIGFTSYWTLPWSEFLLGILALLMAKIWERGIQLKEEQEFTI